MSNSATLKGAEIECVKRLAKMYEQGQTVWWNEDDYELLGLTVDNYFSVIGTMDLCGVITNHSHTSAGKYRMFEITPMAVQIARQIEQQELEENEGKDIVEKIKQKARSSPALAWIIIGFFLLMAIATFINQTIGIFQNLGWMKKP